MQRRPALPIALCVMAGSIAGCMGGSGPVPSSHEVSQAVRALVISNYARFGRSASSQHADSRDPARVTVTQVQDQGCNLAPDRSSYLCETVIDLTLTTGDKKQLSRLVRLVKTRTGWQATMQ